jgi:regulator of replication initiation timing
MFGILGLRNILSVFLQVSKYNENEKKNKLLIIELDELKKQIKHTKQEINTIDNIKKFQWLSIESIKKLSQEQTELEKVLARAITEHDDVLLPKMRYVHCETHLKDIVYPDEFILLIEKLYNLSMSFSNAEDLKYDKINKAGRKITKGGWFPESDFYNISPCSKVIIPENIIEWFNTFDEFLRDCRSGYIHLTEFGYEPEKQVPYRLCDYTCELTFDWYYDLPGIFIFKEQLMMLIEECDTLKLHYEETKIMLEDYLKETLFKEIDIKAICAKIIEEPRDKRGNIRRLYDNKTICPTDMHKIAICIFLSSESTAEYELKLSMEPPARYRSGW